MLSRPQSHKFARVAERVVQVWAGVAALVFLVTGVVYLYFGRWTVIQRDYWAIYENYFTRSWLESALCKYYNHSLFFPTLLRLADLHFFHGDQQPLFFVGLALLFITASLLLIPIWRDKTVSLTGKITSTLVVIAGNFWMGRSIITASGSFNCENSLAMAGAALAFLFLPKMCASGVGFLQPTLIVLFAGVVASFSCAQGLAIWPAVLCLGWFLRLPTRCIGLLITAGLATGVVFALLPEYFAGAPSMHAIGFDLLWLCRLVGSPGSDVAIAWWAKEPYLCLIKYPSLATITGAAGLALLAVAAIPQIIRRDVGKSSIEFTGLALVLFNILALLLVVAGRSGHISISAGATLPRYFFWSALFWTGLLLVGIARADAKPRLRWIVYVVVLTLSLMIFPAHYKNALHMRRLRIVAESGATSLINGVQLDEQQIKALSGKGAPIELLYRVAEEMRKRRLDMFAEGLQDWIGLQETNLFGGRYKREGLRGQCKVDALVQCDNGAPAARITGQLWKRRHRIPHTLVIVDPMGVVRGIGRSSSMYSENRFVNTLFYWRKVPGTRFLGYIRDYNPQLHYVVRSADDSALSEETIPVQEFDNETPPASAQVASGLQQRAKARRFCDVLKSVAASRLR